METVPAPGSAQTESLSWGDVAGFVQRKLFGAGNDRRGFAIVVLVVTLLQALWLGGLMAAGWFFGDDFDFLGDAHANPLTWHYLAAPVAGHLAPGLRLVFWLLSRLDALPWTLTVIVRLVVQAATTVGLAVLLRRLAVTTRVIAAVLLVYCLSPLIVPVSTYLSSSVNQLPSQLFLVLAALAAERGTRGDRRWAWWLASGLALAAAACFWEKAALDGVFVLAAIALARRPDRRRWWVVTPAGALAAACAVAPLAVFGGFFLAGHYGEQAAAGQLPAGSALRLLGQQWENVWSTVVGGPWHWYVAKSAFDSVASPSTAAIVLGQVVAGALLVLTWRRRGARALCWWLLPVVCLVVGELVVAWSRFGLLGGFTASDFHFAGDLAVPFAIGIGCALGRPSTRQRDPAGTTAATSRWRAGRWSHRRLVTVVAAVAFAASATTSASLWVATFHRSGAHSYLSALAADARAQGPTVELFDVGPPESVVPFIEPHRRISDLLADMGLTASFGRGDAPMTVDPRGHVVPAQFVPAATTGALPGANQFCARLVQGVGTWRLPLDGELGGSYYFVQATYFQQRPVGLLVTVLDAQGHQVPVRGSAIIADRDQVATDYLALDYGTPREIVLTSTSPSTNVCLTQLSIGLPVHS